MNRDCAPKAHRSGWNPTTKAFRFALLTTLVCLLALVGCGPKDTPGTKTPEQASLEDALALLPGGAIAVGTVDARAFFGSQTFGPDLVKLVEKYVPLGQEAGFSASRDVDRVTFASYSYQGVDVAAVVIGKFDESKFKQMAAQHVPSKSGATLVASSYAGRDVYTISNVGFSILSETRAVAGTESGIRRVLDRIKDNRVKREIPPWMLETVETPGAAAAVAVDMATQPMPQEVAARIPLSYIQTLKAARVVASFKDNGTQLAGAFTYADEATATQQGAAVKQAAGMSRWLSLIGITVKNVEVKTEKADVQVMLAIDDQSLRQMLATVPQWMGQ